MIVRDPDFILISELKDSENPDTQLVHRGIAQGTRRTLLAGRDGIFAFGTEATG
jgi:hypothetical protein